ncbi:MAG: hypothetical protein NUV56_02130, partial [Candidatus Uhrbacteria bacterium]|nr:hypothetical protein [Candidatus Uhrbacteria bacterium]
PGAFGKQILYLNGLELYLHAGDWPTLAPGDRVNVVGTVSVAQGNHRLKLASSRGITVVGHVDVSPREATHVDDLKHGELVRMRGNVDKHDGLLILQLNETDSITIELPDDMTPRMVMPGGVTMTGIIRLKNGTPMLALRSIEDAVADPASSQIAATTGITAPPKNHQLAGLLLALGAIGFLGACYGLTRMAKAKASSLLKPNLA